jgi:hypothetical protein
MTSLMSDFSSLSIAGPESTGWVAQTDTSTAPAEEEKNILAAIVSELPDRSYHQE